MPQKVFRMLEGGIRLINYVIVSNTFEQNDKFKIGSSMKLVLQFFYFFYFFYKKKRVQNLETTQYDTHDDMDEKT